MRPKASDKLRVFKPWQSAPPWSIAVFLSAVFFIFASFGFVLDGMDMGRQPLLRFSITVVLIGIFAECYAISGISFRNRFWIPLIPVFIVQNVCMALLNRWLPDAPAVTQLDAAGLSQFHHRLVLNGVATMTSVVLGYIGFVVVSVFESRRRTRSELDKAALEGELAAAREIQRLMVADGLPLAPGFTIESVYRPASQVGGDFFQVISLGNGQTLVVIGDVSGKGLSAAMIVSMIIGMIRTVTGISHDPAQILSELNGKLIERHHGGFVTCMAARLDSAGGVVCANAGHLPPCLNGFEIRFSGSLPLGLVPTLDPESVAFEMERNDRLTVFTDGVVEARDAKGQLFGFDRTFAFLKKRLPAEDLAEAAHQHGQDDDITIISIDCTK